MNETESPIPAFADDKQLLACVEKCNKPERSKLAEVTSLIASCANGREAWERLNTLGVLPDSWLDDPQRRFVLTKYKPTNPPTPGVIDINTFPAQQPVWAGPNPLLRPEVALYACAPSEITTVEGLAREAVARLWPWLPFSGAPPTMICWQNQGPTHHDDLGLEVGSRGYVAELAARRVLGLTTEKYVQRQLHLENWTRATKHPPRKAMLRDGLAARDFRSATLTDHLIPSRIYNNNSVHPLGGQRFAMMLNPFEPAFDVWTRGYCMGPITPNWIVLYMAPLPRTPQTTTEKKAKRRA